VRLAEPAESTAQVEVTAPTECYDVLLLAGTPRRHTCMLPGVIATGTLIDVDGGQWTVADVRAADAGPTRLICIYAV
jgi:hypothetical protein